MFGLKQKRLKKKRKIQYDELNKLFREKHNIIGNWFVKKYGCGIAAPYSPEGAKYQSRLKQFFDIQYGELPKSYNLFANVSYGASDFDPNPVEKLQELYDQIEIVFPEPFIKIHREEKLNNLNKIV